MLVSLSVFPKSAIAQDIAADRRPLPEETSPRIRGLETKLT
jgi:hypothetical protein